MFNNDEERKSTKGLVSKITKLDSAGDNKLIELSFIVNSLNQNSYSINSSKSLNHEDQGSIESSESHASVEEDKMNSLSQKTFCKFTDPKISIHSNKNSFDFTLTESEFENHPVLLAESNQKKNFSSRQTSDFFHIKSGIGTTEIKKLEKNCCEMNEIPIQDSMAFPKLQYLSYNKNRIRKIPSHISSFVNLQELILDNNFISEIPEVISSLKNLNSFSISHNLLTNIAPSIGSLNSLKILLINNNLIYELPKSLFNLNLEIFHFHHNKITELPSQFYKFKNILEISFDWFYYISPFTMKLNNKKIGKIVITDFYKLCKYLDKLNQNCLFPTFISFFYKRAFEELLNTPIYGKGKTLLHKAAFYGDLGIIKSILSYKSCDINKLDHNQCSALLISLKANKLEVTFELLKNPSCNVNLGSSKFGAPLLIALTQQKYNIVELILSRDNCITKITDKEGNNPFHIIFGKYKIKEPIIEKICDQLIEKKCPVNIKNIFNISPLQIAIKKNQKASLEYALRKNKIGKIFDFNLCGGKYDWNALHFAVVYSDLDVLIELLQSDLNLFTIDKQGKSPIDLAIIKSIPQKIIKKAQKKKFKEMLYITERERVKCKKINFGISYFLISQKRKVNVNQGNELSEGDNEVEGKIKEYSQENVKITNASKSNFRRQISLDISKFSSNCNKPRSLKSIIPASKNYIFSGSKNPSYKIPEIICSSTRAANSQNCTKFSQDLNSKIHLIKVFSIHKNYEFESKDAYKSNHVSSNSLLEFEGKKCIEEKIFEKFNLADKLQKYKNNSIPIFMKSRILYSIFVKKPLDFKQILQILSNYSLNKSLIESIFYLSMLMDILNQNQFNQKINKEQFFDKNSNRSQKMLNQINTLKFRETKEGEFLKTNSIFLKLHKNNSFYKLDIFKKKMH